MKAKRAQAKIDPAGAGHGATGSQISMPKPPAFAIRLPLPAKLGADMKSSQTVFEKVVDGRRFRVVQTVVASGQAKAPATTRGRVRRLAEWQSIPSGAARKRWFH